MYSLTRDASRGDVGGSSEGMRLEVGMLKRKAMLRLEKHLNIC